ncbi:hypothetical protein LJB87_00955 [Alistipes sp. OttesenSCG-928-L06]|nr:hypothetical protein [Alistipes sp. OttesenSCG-928-L06]
MGLFLLIALGIIVLVVIILTVKYYTNPSHRKAVDLLTAEHEESAIQSRFKDENYYTKGHLNIWLPIRDGYKKFDMVGMYYRKLKKSDMGEFEGYAKAEEGNSYDRYAVAIYKDSGKHVGYLPKGNRIIHKQIQDNGGSTPAYGFISCDSSGDNFIAEVGILVDSQIS